MLLRPVDVPQRRPRLVTIAVACLAFLFTAGVAAHAWGGHGTAELAYEDAIAIARDPNCEAERRRAAASLVGRVAIDSVSRLIELQGEAGPVGIEARARIEHVNHLLGH